MSYESNPLLRKALKVSILIMGVFVCCPLPVLLTGAHITMGLVDVELARCNLQPNLEKVLACISAVQAQTASHQIQTTVTLFVIAVFAVSIVGIVVLSFSPILRGSRRDPRIHWGLE